MSGVVARLGHVLGWTGNGLAVLALLAGCAGIVNVGWNYWNSKVPAALEIMIPGGSR